MIQTPNDEHIRFSAKFSCQWGGHKSQECRQAAAYWPLIQILIHIDTNAVRGKDSAINAGIEHLLNTIRYSFDVTKKPKNFRQQTDHSDSVAPGKFFVRLWRSWSMHSALPWEGSDGSVVESCWDCWDGQSFSKWQILCRPRVPPCQICVFGF